MSLYILIKINIHTIASCSSKNEWFLWSYVNSQLRR